MSVGWVSEQITHNSHFGNESFQPITWLRYWQVSSANCTVLFVTYKYLNWAGFTPSLCHNGWSVEVLQWQHVAACDSISTCHMSVTVFREVIAADKLPTADATLVTFLPRVAATVTRQLVRPSESLLAVWPHTCEWFLAFTKTHQTAVHRLLFTDANYSCMSVASIMYRFQCYTGHGATFVTPETLGYGQGCLCCKTNLKLSLYQQKML